MNEYLARAYPDDGISRQELMDRRKAEDWKYSPDMEQLADIRNSDPAMYDRMGPSAHMALGYYESNKEMAQRMGRDVTKPGKDGK